MVDEQALRWAGLTREASEGKGQATDAVDSPQCSSRVLHDSRVPSFCRFDAPLQEGGNQEAYTRAREPSSPDTRSQ